MKLNKNKLLFSIQSKIIRMNNNHINNNKNKKKKLSKIFSIKNNNKQRKEILKFKHKIKTIAVI